MEQRLPRKRYEVSSAGRPLRVHTIVTINIASSTADEPIVPNPSPPFSGGLVSKSPNVAPKGRVSTNAAQKSAIGEIEVR